MIVPPRPLPDSLTRLLTAPADYPIAPTPGDRRPGEAPDASTVRGGALEATVLRGFVVLLAGLVWLAILGLVVRHLLP